MGRQLNLVIVLGLTVIASSCKPHVAPQKSPREVVEQFYKLETQGRWLGSEHWDELKDYSGEIPVWSPPEAISVLQTYRVTNLQRQTGNKGEAKFRADVEFKVWGTIDPFLQFALARDGRDGGSPIGERTNDTFALQDWYVNRSTEPQKVEKSRLRWRITMFPRVPRVDVPTALRYVAEMRAKSKGPFMQYNADQTLAILKGTLNGTPPPERQIGSAQETPSQVTQRFMRWESVSSPDQWSRLARFFVETPRPQWDKVHIVDIMDVGAEVRLDTADAGISTNSLGELDSSLYLTNYPSERPVNSPNNACNGDDMFGFTLLLSDKHWEIAADGSVTELDGPLAWRIRDTSFEPLITLDTAIRYVKQAR